MIAKNLTNNIKKSQCKYLEQNNNQGLVGMCRQKII